MNSETIKDHLSRALAYASRSIAKSNNVYTDILFYQVYDTEPIAFYHTNQPMDESTVKYLMDNINKVARIMCEHTTIRGGLLTTELALGYVTNKDVINLSDLLYQSMLNQEFAKRMEKFNKRTKNSTEEEMLREYASNMLKTLNDKSQFPIRTNSHNYIDAFIDASVLDHKITSEALLTAYDLCLKKGIDTSKIPDLLYQKNKDYKDSFKTSYERFEKRQKGNGATAVQVRICDKWSRYYNLRKPNVEASVSDEKIGDTLKDLLGYLILTSYNLFNKKGN